MKLQENRRAKQNKGNFEKNESEQEKHIEEVKTKWKQLGKKKNI